MIDKVSTYFRDVLSPVVVLVLVGVVAYDRLVPRNPALNPAVVDGRALGKAYAGTLAGSFGDAWNAAADAIEQGKTVTEAQDVLQKSWQAGRASAFARQVAPKFAHILPEGAEPTGPDQRREVAALWRSFAQGLKGVR